VGQKKSRRAKESCGEQQCKALKSEESPKKSRKRGVM